ncbi:hypothetical protein [Brevundimonas sp.]|jgi:hypothetical protein|uniref:hypothetical protein n=1 Tax=Brevundimonas sp. TaxID=1871086 RepID=UPI002E101836|nr:hypothetical protein [Brevundimonas sp.]
MTDAHRIRSAETWDRARDDYLAGVTGQEVCRRHDLAPSTFWARAQAEGWRRSDQPDPEPEADDLEPYAGVDLTELVDLAWRRLARAIDRGASVEAARWARLHADLHARAQAAALAESQEAGQAEHLARVCPGEVHRPRPRLGPDGRDVHALESLESNFSGDAPLNRAERRRREREARRRS